MPGSKSGDLLTDRDVLVVDEAGMIGSRQMERQLGAAQAAGAMMAPGAAAGDRGWSGVAGCCRAGWWRWTSAEVRRQREAWQQEATRALATGRTEKVLDRYAAAGMVREHATEGAAQEAMIAAWDAVRLESATQSQIILAHTGRTWRR